MKAPTTDRFEDLDIFVYDGFVLALSKLSLLPQLPLFKSAEK